MEHIELICLSIGETFFALEAGNVLQVENPANISRSDDVAAVTFECLQIQRIQLGKILNLPPPSNSSYSGKRIAIVSCGGKMLALEVDGAWKMELEPEEVFPPPQSMYSGCIKAIARIDGDLLYILDADGIANRAEPRTISQAA